MTHSYQTGCRCTECRESNRVYQLRYRQRRRLKEAESLRSELAREFEALGIEPGYAQVAATTAYQILRGDK